jgi:hypothetical protein
MADPFTIGLTLGGIGLGGQLLGQLFTGLGTEVQPNITDDEIAAAQGASRRALTADLRQRESMAARGVASRAAGNRTLTSGLATRSLQGVQSEGLRSREALEAQLLNARLSAMANRTYRADLNPLGITGRALATASGPLAQLGAMSLASRTFGHQQAAQTAQGLASSNPEVFVRGQSLGTARALAPAIPQVTQPASAAALSAAGQSIPTITRTMPQNLPPPVSLMAPQQQGFGQFFIPAPPGGSALDPFTGQPVSTPWANPGIYDQIRDYYGGGR